jgi:hypothetical protein
MPDILHRISIDTIQAGLMAADRIGLRPSVRSLTTERLLRAPPDPRSGIRGGICVRVLEFRIYPAFPVLL